MKVSEDAKAICRSIDALTKEIKWLAVLVEETRRKIRNLKRIRMEQDPQGDPPHRTRHLQSRSTGRG